MPRAMWSPDPVVSQQIIALYKDGVSSAKIIEVLSLEIGDPKTLIRWLRRNGIEIKPRGIQLMPFKCDGCGLDFEIHSIRLKGELALCFSCAPNEGWQERYRKYQITKPQFDEMLEKQSGLCDLCELPLPADLFKIRIDHCHKQGHVRGLLHNKCNIGLHYIENDKFFASAIRYVERYRR